MADSPRNDTCSDVGLIGIGFPEVRFQMYLGHRIENVHVWLWHRYEQVSIFEKKEDVRECTTWETIGIKIHNIVYPTLIHESVKFEEAIAGFKF